MSKTEAVRFIPGVTRGSRASPPAAPRSSDGALPARHSGVAAQGAWVSGRRPAEEGAERILLPLALLIEGHGGHGSSKCAAPSARRAAEPKEEVAEGARLKARTAAAPVPLGVAGLSPIARHKQ
mmetsp:Transcript_14242/g.50025  ORF Transcript_14242/g.50025 Transcript_14242/m.50025 type:complete len:124 (+) Transcript_14242:1172-1543(+)